MVLRHQAKREKFYFAPLWSEARTAIKVVRFALMCKIVVNVTSKNLDANENLFFFAVVPKEKQNLSIDVTRYKEQKKQPPKYNIYQYIVEYARHDKII